MDPYRKRKRNLFFTADTILTLTAFIYLHYNLINGDVKLAVVEGAIGFVYLGLALLVIRKQSGLQIASWILVLITTGFMIVAVCLFQFRVANIIWMLMPYFLSMFLLGLRSGLIVSCILFISTLLGLIFQYQNGEYMLIPIDLIGIVIANVFSLVFAAYYEMARVENEKELMEKNREIEILSNHDGLTGLYNRRYFDLMLNNEFHRAKREKQPLSLIIGDIDLFKKYNDTYGHLQGDACLNEVANAINAAIKRITDTATRYGGEEFAILLPNTNAKGATKVAERIRANMLNKAIHHPMGGKSDIVTLSLGIAVLSQQEDQEPSDLLLRADRALYVSKSKGRDRITIL